jgi:hypothetical protein
MFLKAAASESEDDSSPSNGEIRAKGRLGVGVQMVLGLLKQLRERERKAGTQLVEVMDTVVDLSFKPEANSSQMSVSST